MATEIKAIQEILKESRRRLLKQGNVVATGLGYKISAGKKAETLSIVCSVSRKLKAAQLSAKDLVPKELAGVPTDVVETGYFRVFQSRTKKVRPAPGGISIGHKDITAGTLGCLVQKDGEIFILSNNHVLANSNEAQKGDPILQPGPHDGGKFPDDQIATLHDFVPIHYIGAPSECSLAKLIQLLLNLLSGLFSRKTRFEIVQVDGVENFVDAAIAKPMIKTAVKDDILEIGSVSGVGEAVLGMPLQKSGRTTGLTKGEILQTDVTVNVQYGVGKVAMFTDQLMAGAMSQGGDSGSAVLDQKRHLVGLLFAGSDNSTIINRIDHVFSALGIKL